MKKMMMIGAMILTACGAMVAQSSSVDHVNVRFSNPVVVNGVTMPAGACTIQVLRGSSDSLVLAVRSESGAVSSVLVNRMDDMDVPFVGKDAQIILSHDGNQYRLESVILPNHSGFQVLPNNQ